MEGLSRATELKRWEAASFMRRLAFGDRRPLFSERVQPAASDYTHDNQCDTRRSKVRSAKTFR